MFQSERSKIVRKLFPPTEALFSHQVIDLHAIGKFPLLNIFVFPKSFITLMKKTDDQSFDTVLIFPSSPLELIVYIFFSWTSGRDNRSCGNVSYIRFYLSFNWCKEFTFAVCLSFLDKAIHLDDRSALGSQHVPFPLMNNLSALHLEQKSILSFHCNVLLLVLFYFQSFLTSLLSTSTGTTDPSNTNPALSPGHDTECDGFNFTFYYIRKKLWSVRSRQWIWSLFKRQEEQFGAAEHISSKGLKT